MSDEETSGATEVEVEERESVATTESDVVADEGSTPPEPAYTLKEIMEGKVKLDLSAIPDGKALQASLQRQIAVEKQRAEAAERRLQAEREEARLSSQIAEMRSDLHNEGLSEDAISKQAGRLEQELTKSRLQNQFYKTVLDSGLTPDEIAAVDKGTSPDDFRANIAVYKREKAEREAQQRLADAEKEIERLTKETAKLTKTKELEERRATGADKVAGGSPKAPASEQDKLRKEYDAEIKRTSSGMGRVNVRAKYRARGLDI